MVDGTNGTIEEEVVVEGDERAADAGDRPHVALADGQRAGNGGAAAEVLGRPLVGRRALAPEKQAEIKRLADTGMNASQITKHFANKGKEHTVNYATVRRYMGNPVPSQAARADGAPRRGRKPRAAGRPATKGRRGRRASNGGGGFDLSEKSLKLAVQIGQLAKSMGIPISEIRSACDLAERLSAALG